MSRETPNKLLISRKWAVEGCRKARFSVADYWITKAKPWFSDLTGAPLLRAAIRANRVVSCAVFLAKPRRRVFT